jgi:hypothetical protein
MLANAPSSEWPSSARSARRRIESRSPASSGEVCRSSAAATPITSADSRRVESEDWRRWCELRLARDGDTGAESRSASAVDRGGSVVLVRAGAECDGGNAKDVGERETEVLRECERTWAPRIGRD